jgi:hypothetical protein
VDHLAGATAIQEILEPLRNSADASATVPSPSQTAHQSSFDQSSCQPERAGATVSSSKEDVEVDPLITPFFAFLHVFLLRRIRDYGLPGIFPGFEAAVNRHCVCEAIGLKIFRCPNSAIVANRAVDDIQFALVRDGGQHVLELGGRADQQKRAGQIFEQRYSLSCTNGLAIGLSSRILCPGSDVSQPTIGCNEEILGRKVTLQVTDLQ